MRGTLLVLVTIYAAADGTDARQAEPAHKTIVLTGCLQKTDAEPGFAITKAQTLSRATPEQVSPAPAIGTSGKPPANVADGVGEYELRPATGISETGVNAKQLQEHVGTRVEITARPIERPLPSTPSSDAIAPEQQPKPRAETQQKIRLTVTAIKPLGSACS